MAVRFEGFARVVERSTLRPGRWIAASLGHSAALCFVTAIGVGSTRSVLTFRPARVEEITFAVLPLAEIPSTLVSVEDDVVFSAGSGLHTVQLVAPSIKPFASGSLLRLADGDLGIAYGGPRAGELKLVSLSSGEEVQGFELVFDHWSLSLRRGSAETLFGRFKGGLDRRISRTGG